MKFTVETKKDLTIFKLQETRLDATVAPELKSEFIVLIEAEGKKYLIIDLSQVDVIDSSGIGAMLVAHRQTADHDGFAAFVGIRNRVRDLLKMTGLDKQLYIFSSIQEAISSIETVDSDDEDEDIIPTAKRSLAPDDEDELTEDLLHGIPEITDDMPFTDLEAPEIEEHDFKEKDEPEEDHDEDEPDDDEGEEKPARKGKGKGKSKDSADKKGTKKAKTTKKKSK
ncbi:MAG: STAS domain-containing protein [Chlorobiales bacterium]|jgi:anti-anti-sigma factor|nr:STAS domain-containing protein [Chlorobiales bacterium]